MLRRCYTRKDRFDSRLLELRSLLQSDAENVERLLIMEAVARDRGTIRDLERLLGPQVQVNGAH